ncbi:DNA-directed RNA polymerase I subunit RPA49 [Cladochytrium tenue]|nr:DNA-directed RNA polymerase I subunit RPA49 [Cladochytrium tenue]
MLAKLYNMKANDLKNAAILNETFGSVPHEVALHMLSGRLATRIGSGRFEQTPRQHDAVLGYLVCLTLLLDEFQVDCGHLSEDLRISEKKVVAMARELGCKVDARVFEGIARKVAKLVVPLNLPVRRK